MSFPRYPKYKASGVEWLGDVPEHWGVKRLKHNARLLTEKTDRRDHPVGLENIEGWSGRFIPTETAFEGEGIAFDAGDILFGKLRPYLAKAYLAQSSGEAVGDFHVMRPAAGIEARFAQYQILNREFIAIVDGSTFGSKMPRASWEFVGGMKVTLPPLPEQTAIAEFLDRETAKIDGLVAEQRQLMELLKEKRQAVISHAVTKGLNPHAPMKPSGIEWLGDVPAGWALKRLQNVCHFQSGKAHEPFICDDGIYMCVTSRFVSTEGMKCKMCSKNISPARRNDTLMVMSDLPNGRALAKAYFVGDERAYAVNQRVCILRPFSVAPKFLYYLLDRNPEFLQHDDGINQTHLSNSEFLKPQFPFPPHDEQVSIAEFLDAELAKFDTLTAEAQRAIDLLQERRTALISAAVTGQIDVRQQLKN